MKSDNKKSGKRFALFLGCFFLFAAARPGALEISKGNARLVLHEQSGRFSLYGMNKDGRFEPLFSDEDPRTSFIEINADNMIYRLGDSSAFRFHVESAGETPAIVFESGDLQVREEFSFINAAGSRSFNGIRLTIRVRNKREGAVNAGLRFLLDSCLGEVSGETPFFINNQSISAETLVGGSVESVWVSRGASLSLMGSIGHGAAAAAGTASEGKNPDYLQFANWKRLSEASWKTQGRAGRNFDAPPYSFNDAALCYYYEPAPLPRYGEFHCTILLSAEDPAGFARSSRTAAVSAGTATPGGVSAGTAAVSAAAGLPAAGEPDSRESAASREDDLTLLRNLISRMDYYLEGQIEIPGEELAEMEQTIARLKARYNIP